MRLLQTITCLILILFHNVTQADDSIATPVPLEFNNYQVDLNGAKLSECPDISDPRLRVIKSPEGINVYAFKEILPEHYKEWKDSLVSDEIIFSNVISIPDVVCQKKNLKRLEFFTPIVDFLGWKRMKVAYHPKIGRSGWIVRGLLPPAFAAENPLNQMKIIGTTRVYKYEQPCLNGIRQFDSLTPYMKISDQQAEFIYKNNKHIPVNKLNFWKEVFESEMPVQITEGAKKAASLLSVGYVGIGLLGACEGIFTFDREQKSIRHRLRKDMLELTKKKRVFYIVFDNDSEPLIKKFVHNAQSILAELLAKEGAEVRIIDLPGPEKGVDDFIVAHGLTAYQKLVQEALSFDKWKKKHSISEEHLLNLSKKFACYI